MTDINLPPISGAQAEILQHYVYVYYDVESERPFYIGRGRGNRMKSHLKGSHNDLVRARIDQGDFGVDFLAYGLDEETASKVEAAAIDLIGIGNLMNKSRGTGSTTYGRVNAQTLLRSIQDKPLTKVPHNLIVVPIKSTFERYGDDPEALYESTRGVWNGISSAKATEADYIAGVVNYRIVYVMTAAAWLPAGSTNYFIRTPGESDDRIEFVGRTAPPEIQDLYVGRHIDHMPQSPNYYGPFNDKVRLVDGNWMP